MSVWRPSAAAGARLAPVIGDAPAAVLLIDLDGRSVVHANSIAAQLAPGVHLPVDLDAWSDAAELRDPDGAELSDTHHPLSRILRGDAVMGQAVTAARHSELGPRREPLWVVALPMRESPELHDHALVVLLPVADRLDGRGGSGSELRHAVDAVLDPAQLFHDGRELRDRALLATGLSFTLADARKPDFPLVWVNPAFTRTTGYSLEEAIGSNCRFLQGPDTDPAVPKAMREALDAGEAITSVLLNYTKDGLPFWNQVTISPILSGDGELTHFVGIQSDVSGRIEADAQRDLALRAEQVARAEAEAAQGRLRLLAEATNRLSGTLDVEECRARLIELAVPGLADWVLVIHLGPAGRIESIDHAHRDPASEERLDRLAADLDAGLRGGPVHDLVLRGRRGRRINDLDAPTSLDERMGYVRDSAILDHSRALGSRSAIFVSLPGRDVDDLMVLVRGTQREQFTDDDLDVAVDLGRRAGLILDNARLFTVQQRIAETLQRSLLPDLPDLPGVRAAARYRAAESGAEVGGDFYELIGLPGRGIGLAVGDVVGHDIYAAAAMGHLKGVLRACAYDASASPAAVLERVDEVLSGLGMPTVATAVYAELEPLADGWRVTWSNAGHPPLLVRGPDGGIELLGGDLDRQDVMLGVGPGPRRTSSRVLPFGSVLIGYTDGLIERRREVIDVGIDRLVATVAGGPGAVEELAEHLVTALGPADGDDVVVIAVELLDPS